MGWNLLVSIPRCFCSFLEKSELLSGLCRFSRCVFWNYFIFGDAFHHPLSTFFLSTTSSQTSSQQLPHITTLPTTHSKLHEDFLDLDAHRQDYVRSLLEFQSFHKQSGLYFQLVELFRNCLNVCCGCLITTLDRHHFIFPFRRCYYRRGT